MFNVLIKPFYSVLFLFSLLRFSVLISADIEQPYVNEIKALIDSSSLADLSVQNASENLPGTVLFANNKVPLRKYPGGVYHYVIHANKKGQIFNFNKEQLVRANALLYVKISSNSQRAQIVLPAMDTVIESPELAGFEFFLGDSSTDTSKAKFYFFTSNKLLSLIDKIKIKARGVVYAVNPDNFAIAPGSLTHQINRIYDTKNAAFFSKYTVGNFDIFETNKNIESLINTKADADHKRPARTHQLKQLLEYIIADKKGHKYFTIGSSTGSGKTNTMLRLAELLAPKKVLILTPRENLLSQIRKEAQRYYPHMKFAGSDQSHSHQNIKGFLSSNIHTHDVMLTTLQGFQGVYKDIDFLRHVDAVIFDEAHHLLSKNRSEMVQYLQSFGDKKLQLFFFTATPNSLKEHKKSKLKSVYQLSGENSDNPHITPFNIFKAIDAKVNVPFQIIQVSNLPKLKEKLVVQNGEYSEEKIGGLLSDERYYKIFLDLYINGVMVIGGQKKPVFGTMVMNFCAGIAHAESLNRFITENLERNLLDKHKSILEAARGAYEKSALEYFPTRRQAVEFVRKYPLVISDVVHSGNEQFKITHEESDNRLLRNQLGGSLILLGATKLMEGYDNPKIELVFMQRPYRKSNIYSLQQLGRALRIDANNPHKVAFILQFIWDNNQLLLTSSDLLGVASYGLDENHQANLVVEQHIPGVLDYELSNRIITSGVVKKGAKRKITTTDEAIKKKPRLIKDPKPVDEDKFPLLVKLKDLLERVKKKAAYLNRSHILYPEPQESMAIDEEDRPAAKNAEEITAEKLLFSPAVQTKPITQQFSTTDQVGLVSEIDMIVSGINTTLKPKALKPTSKGPEAERSSLSVSQAPLPQLKNEQEILKDYIQKANRALQRAERFFAENQMHADTEWVSFRSELNDIFSQVSSPSGTHNWQDKSSLASSSRTTLTTNPVESQVAVVANNAIVSPIDFSLVHAPANQENDTTDSINKAAEQFCNDISMTFYDVHDLYKFFATHGVIHTSRERVAQLAAAVLERHIAQRGAKEVLSTKYENQITLLEHYKDHPDLLDVVVGLCIKYAIPVPKPSIWLSAPTFLSNLDMNGKNATLLEYVLLGLGGDSQEIGYGAYLAVIAKVLGGNMYYGDIDAKTLLKSSWIRKSLTKPDNQGQQPLFLVHHPLDRRAILEHLYSQQTNNSILLGRITILEYFLNSVCSNDSDSLYVAEKALDDFWQWKLAPHERFELKIKQQSFLGGPKVFANKVFLYLLNSQTQIGLNRVINILSQFLKIYDYNPDVINEITSVLPLNVNNTILGVGNFRGIASYLSGLNEQKMGASGAAPRFAPTNTSQTGMVGHNSTQTFLPPVQPLEVPFAQPQNVPSNSAGSAPGSALGVLNLDHWIAKALDRYMADYELVDLVPEAIHGVVGWILKQAKCQNCGLGSPIYTDTYGKFVAKLLPLLKGRYGYDALKAQLLSEPFLYDSFKRAGFEF